MLYKKVSKDLLYHSSRQGEPDSPDPITENSLDSAMLKRQQGAGTINKAVQPPGLLSKLDFSANGLVQGILYSEILGKPLCKRGPRRF